MQSCLCSLKLGQNLLRQTLFASRSHIIRPLKVRHLSSHSRHKYTATKVASPEDTSVYAVIQGDRVQEERKQNGTESRTPKIGQEEALANYLDIEDDKERKRHWKRVQPRLQWDSPQLMLIHYIHTAHLERRDWDKYDFLMQNATQNTLVRMGASSADLESWASVFLENNADDRVHRFLDTTSQSRYPQFLLLEVCRKDIRRVETLKAIIAHIWDRFLRKRDLMSDGSRPGDMITNPISLSRLEENAFISLVRYLLHHCRRIWPAAMVTVARMVGAYIDTLQIKTRDGVKIPEDKIYQRMCSLQNEVLQYLSIPAAFQPYHSMDYNWPAQKVILALSGQFSPPLTLDQPAYQAVLKVLAASKKSLAEVRSATLRARTWPPWRIEQDGMDAQREPEEDMSRIIAALVRKRESGYSDVPYDQVMSILGGQEPDGTPTIQTRSITNPRCEIGKKSTKGLPPTSWAARVAATRDVQEAWAAFTQFLKAGGRPDLSMYQAMFSKLVYERKRSATGKEPSGAPGDGPEVFSVPDDNVSEFYRSRLQPPSISQLYQTMTESGLRPSGRLLSFLVRQAAPTLSEALQYLVDSGTSEQALQYLHRTPFHTSSARQSWGQIVSQRLTNDFVIMLCRFAPRSVRIPIRKRGADEARDDGSSDMRRVVRFAGHKQHHPMFRRPLQHAAHLLEVAGTTERAAWYALWKALSKRGTVLLLDRPQDPKNFEIAWRIMMRSFHHFKLLGLELDPKGFIYICEAFIKYMKLPNTSSTPRQSLRKTVDTTMIKKEFRRLTTAYDMDPSYQLPRFLHDFHGAHIHAYVRSMASAHDHAEMLSTLKWMASHATDLDQMASRHQNGPRLLRRTLISIRVSCEGTSVEDEVRALIESVESWDGWPSDDEVETYHSKYEMDYVDEVIAEKTYDEPTEEEAEKHDQDVEKETEDFFQQELVISRYHAGR